MGVLDGFAKAIASARTAVCSAAAAAAAARSVSSLTDGKLLT